MGEEGEEGGRPDDTQISNQPKYFLMQYKWHVHNLLNLLGIIHTVIHIDRGAIFLLYSTNNC